jgi:hypothetical protein
VWHASVDRREAPRWRPEWISPEQVEAETIGRCANSIGLLPKARRPRAWTNVVKRAMERLAKKKKAITPFFPGPMEEFSEIAISAPTNPALTDVEKRLKTASNLEKVRGLAALGYLGKPSESAVEDVRRLLRSSRLTLGRDVVREDLIGICAHIAACSRHEALANTVIDYCMGLVANGSAKNDVELFLIISEACAAFLERSAYHAALGRAATRLAYAIPFSRQTRPLRSVLEILGQRDAKLIPALSRAAALLDAVEHGH